MPKVQIIIPCINLWKEYTKNCIDSVKTKYEHRILLIDNASDDDTRVEAGKLVSNSFAHQRNEERWSFSKSVNFGVKDGFDRGYDYVLVLNNDVLCHPEMIDRMVERFNLNHSPIGILSEQKTLAMVTALDVRGEFNPPEELYKASPDIKKDVPEAEHPCFSAFMMSEDAWAKVGEFDEAFVPAYFEDNDYHYRVNLSGMKAIVLPTAMFYHFASKTAPIASTNFTFEMNRAYFIAKWGDMPSKERFKTAFNVADRPVTWTKQDLPKSIDEVEKKPEDYKKN